MLWEERFAEAYTVLQSLLLGEKVGGTAARMRGNSKPAVLSLVCVGGKTLPNAPHQLHCRSAASPQGEAFGKDESFILLNLKCAVPSISSLPHRQWLPLGGT